MLQHVQLQVTLLKLPITLWTLHPLSQLGLYHSNAIFAIRHDVETFPQLTSLVVRIVIVSPSFVRHLVSCLFFFQTAGLFGIFLLVAILTRLHFLLSFGPFG